MISSIPSPKRHLFQVNRHVRASIMLLSIMDGAELDLNNTILSSSSKPTTATTTSSSISTSDDYEKDLQLAAELGRCLLERNQELQNYIDILQKQIDDEQCSIKLLHAKLESTREQLDTKCKQTEILDAANFDLERELARQRRDNEINRQRIQELSDLCEKIRKQYLEIEHEYETFRLKQFANHFFPKQLNSSIQKSNISTLKSIKLRRSHSFNLNSTSNSSSSSSNLSTSSNIFDISSALVFKTHLTELKSRINSLTTECSGLNEKLDKSRQEKRYLIGRITLLERQRRDDNDSLQNELNHYKKLLEKYTNDNSNIILSNIYSPPEHEVSLYDEVLLENKQSMNKPSYEPTNYKDLFANVYEKLKISNNNNNNDA
ncbi:unnamed protein product [Rotaria sordida]|uniref:Uncharacterized protein n=1 Tax=Rotaria sordida TaxID=392033 RepID=A0A815DTB7_9BILA|nr:unnamed protein product [Rotaria sordida]CAF1297829.1 unnamed protein product [Rotaria sordida]CAF1364197.1 unnamed protein product [Rotaria sordida]CAF1414348.1 unnamed protein product [Rotaria sordida]CAF1538249.1 unnamed protein product [Rotaria sordida]